MPQTIQEQFPLDPKLYNLKDDEKEFFKICTGIQDDDDLRKHILDVQAKAYAVYPYPCIRRFSFTSMKIARYPAYHDVLKIGRERPGAVLVDIGTCFGNDARKAIVDGFPRENVLGTDLQAEFWTLGHKLFKSSEETFPVAFLPGDIFDSAFLSPNISPAPTSSVPPTPAPSLSTLTSLNPLQHHISVIHASAFFHLFSEPKQSQIAHLLGTLLSPLPGSTILGSHRGMPDTQENAEGSTLVWEAKGHHVEMFAHSPTSWEKMWAGEGGVFQLGDVALTTRASIDPTLVDPRYEPYLLVWSVTRQG